jgi:hypothetical protein
MSRVQPAMEPTPLPRPAAATPPPAAPAAEPTWTPPVQRRSIPAPVAPEALPVAEELSAEPVAVVLWPLVAFNWVVDAVLGLFGPPGQLLRSGFGKNLLGLAGIALFVLTVAHVATDRGWVALPFPVPWPR